MTVAIKTLGSLIILFCCFVLGEYLGQRTARRIGQLSEMGLGIGFLAGDIEMNMSPAVVSAERISKRLKEPAALIFKDFAKRLSKGESVERAWVRALTYCSDKTYFKAEDIERLYPLGKILECLDVTNQRKGFDSIRAYIERKTAALESESMKTRGFYRSVSLLGGIFAVVIMF